MFLVQKLSKATVQHCWWCRRVSRNKKASWGHTTEKQPSNQKGKKNRLADTRKGGNTPSYFGSTSGRPSSHKSADKTTVRHPDWECCGHPLFMQTENKNSNRIGGGTEGRGKFTLRRKRRITAAVKGVSLPLTNPNASEEETQMTDTRRVPAFTDDGKSSAGFVSSCSGWKNKRGWSHSSGFTPNNVGAFFTLFHRVHGPEWLLIS